MTGRAITIAVALIGSASSANAQDSTLAGGRLEIAGQAPNACVIRAPTGGGGVNAVFESAGETSGRVRITELVDPTTALARSASVDLVVPVVCNGPHRVTLRSGNGGLQRLGTPVQGEGFTSLLPYSMGILWGADQSSLATDSGSALVLNAREARAGQLSLQIAIAPRDRPLVAGTYSDQIVLEFQAAN